jgi:hypothetical protein
MATVIPAPERINPFKDLPGMVGMYYGMKNDKARTDIMRKESADRTALAEKSFTSEEQYRNRMVSLREDELYNQNIVNAAQVEKLQSDIAHNKLVDKYLPDDMATQRAFTLAKTKEAEANALQAQAEAETWAKLRPMMQVQQIQDNIFRSFMNESSAFNQLASDPSLTPEARDAAKFNSVLSTARALTGGNEVAATNLAKNSFASNFTAANLDYTNITNDLKDIQKSYNSGESSDATLSYFYRLQSSINPQDGIPANRIDVEFGNLLKNSKDSGFLNDVEVDKGFLNDTELSTYIQKGTLLSEIVTDPKKLHTMMSSIRGTKNPKLQTLYGILERYAGGKVSTNQGQAQPQSNQQTWSTATPVLGDPNQFKRTQ